MNLDVKNKMNLAVRTLLMFSIMFVTIIALSVLFQDRCYAQIIDTTKSIADTTDLNNDIQEEILLENSLEDTEDSKLLDFLEALKKSPYDLNIVTQRDLGTIPFLGEVIARNIIAYRVKNQKFNSKKELMSVDGMTEDLYEKIKLYFIVSSSTTDYATDETGNVQLEKDVRRSDTKKSFGVRFRSRFLQDLQPREGFLNGKYEGSRPKVYNQLNLEYIRTAYSLRGNFTIEKDAGETSITDFQSGYLELSNYKFVNKAIVGDYVLNFGQGIGMWSSLSYSKGSEAVNTVKKSSTGLKSYSSVNEVQFFRGAATEMGYKDFRVTAFYSNNYLDATIDTTLDETSSVNFAGYHRTLSELSKAGSLREQLFGGRVVYDGGNLKLGSAYWTSTYSKLFIPDSLKQLYNFSGDNANMFSVDYDFVFQNMNFYGEYARSQSGKIGGISGVEFTFYKLADLAFAYRYYPEDFTPVHSFGFGENSGNTQNESGLYAGITIRPLKNLVVNAYYDQFKFPYRTYYDPVSTQGNDFLVNATWKVARGLTLEFKYRNKNKEETRTVQDEFNRDVKKVDTRSQTNLRTGFIYEFGGRFRLKSRFDYVYVGYDKYGGDNKGFMFYSDFRAGLIKNLSFSTRLAFFQTDDYDSRVYEFEDDIRGVMSNVGLYGKGRRWYVVLKYAPYKGVSFEGKYAETNIDAAKSIGTGYDTIIGDINNKLSLGLELNF